MKKLVYCCEYCEEVLRPGQQVVKCSETGMLFCDHECNDEFLHDKYPAWEMTLEEAEE